MPSASHGDVELSDSTTNSQSRALNQFLAGVELKAYKMYLLAYRNLGIFQENIVNRVLEDIVSATKPRKVTVVGDFTPRGGIYSKISASYERKD